MNKILTFTTVAVGLFACGGITRAQVVSVSLNTTYSPPLTGGSNGYDGGLPYNYDAGVASAGNG
jgi:hypothetical protein